MPIKITSLTSKHVEAAFTLATEVFIENSTLHKALEIDLKTYRDYLQPCFNAMIAEGISVVAFDRETEAMLGCLIATDFYQHLEPQISPGDPFAPLAALGAALGRQYKLMRTIAPGDVVLVDMGAVSTNAAGKGVYQLMRNALHQLAKDRGFHSVVGELSSSSTQHVVLNKLGHQKRAEVIFANFTFEGGYPFRSIKEPQSIILAEGSV